MSVFFHSFPSAVILIIIAMVLREYKMRDLNVIVYLGLYGIRSSSVALIAHVCVKLIKQYIKNKINILMMVSSAIIFYTYPQSSTLITLIALGALSMLMIEYDTESRNENSSPSI
jgi:chromate transport protein ChrA